MALVKFRALVQRCVNAFGYRIERVRERVEAPIDVLDLLLTRPSAERSDFFFVQVGANDGVTDDPIRKYVTRYHWRGLLVEPQPRVFQALLANYAGEKQLLFENAAVADADGTARLFVADHDHEAANLTVYSSLKRDTLVHTLGGGRAAGVRARVTEVEVPALCVRSLLARHGVSRVDLLQTDVQGSDREVVEQFLDCGVRPGVLHFEHCHTPRPALNALYRRLVKDGYRFAEFEYDTVAYTP